MNSKAHLLLFILTTLQINAHAAGYADGKCNPELEIQEKLYAWREIRKRAFTKEDWFQAEIDFSARLAEQYPDDIYIQREIDAWIYQRPSKREALLAERKSQYRTDPENVNAVYLYARLLSYERSLQAVQILEKVLLKHPGFAQARLLLAQAYKNLQKTRGTAAEIDQVRLYRNLCPENAEGYLAMRGFPKSDYVQNEISSLKSKFDANLTPADLGLIKAYWELAFLQYPPESHKKIREDVDIWLTRLQQQEYPWSLPDLQTFISGFAVSQNFLGKTLAEDAMLRNFPGTDSARAVLDDRWQEKRKRIGAATEKFTDASSNQLDELKQVNQLIESAPFHPQLLYRKFLVLRGIESTTNEKLLALGKQLKNGMLSSHGNMRSYPPPLLVLADEYVARGIGFDQIAELVNEAFNSISEMRKDADAMFTHNQEGRNNFLAELDSQETLGLCLIAEVAASIGDTTFATRQIDLARSNLAKYSLIDPGDRRHGIYLFALARYQRALAMLEVAKGNIQLALEVLLIAEGLAKQTSLAPWWTTKNVIAERAISLKAQLEKLPDNHKTDSDSGTVLEASARPNTWLELKTPFPLISLTDLEGKIWHSMDWRGKIVFLNFWATWCGPCRVELPLIQSLRDKFAGHSNIVFVTINVDDDPSLLIPFLSSYKITLPVLLGGDKRESLLGIQGGTVPISLILDEKGIVRKRQLGFVNDKHWVKSAEDALNAVSTQNRSHR